jgi:hypothetical protein
LTRILCNLLQINRDKVKYSDIKNKRVTVIQKKLITNRIYVLKVVKKFINSKIQVLCHLIKKLLTWKSNINQLEIKNYILLEFKSV